MNIPRSLAVQGLVKAAIFRTPTFSGLSLVSCAEASDIWPSNNPAATAKIPALRCPRFFITMFSNMLDL